VRSGWSVRELKRQIATSLFERLLLSEGKANKEKVYELAAKGQELAEPKDIIKDPYVFEFLGIPERKAILESDLEKAVNLDVTHISIYELEVHEKTMFGINNYQLADEETRYLMYRKIIEYLNAHSYRQYEVSNFALPYSQSQHNLIYWHYEDYYGAGLAACGKIGNERYENTHNFMDYLNGNYRLEVNKLSLEEVRFEAIMMGLRLTEGINIERYNEKHGCQLLKHYEKAIEKNVNKGLLRIDNGCLKTTSMGMMVLNDILVDFMNWL
jgi:oxygen-independent coproporphyrinogen-3 oxidase